MVMAEAPTDAEERAKLAMDEMDQLDSAPVGGMSMTDIASGPATYPLAGVVGQEAIKTALLLCGVNPSVGGVVIAGSRGTAKSVMARAIHKLMPPIEIVKGSDFNIDPSSGEYDTFLREQIAKGEVDAEGLETEVIPTPFVQVRRAARPCRSAAAPLPAAISASQCPRPPKPAGSRTAAPAPV